MMYGYGNMISPTNRLFGGGGANPAFLMTIDTTQPGSASDTFILPCGSIGTYNATIDWGDGSTSNITTYNDADLTHVYSVGGTYQIEINGSLPYINFSFGGDKLKAISIDNWGSNQWLSMQQAFGGCTNLTIPATDVPDFSLCTSFFRAFRDCPLGTLTNTNQWDMSSATRIDSIFENTSIQGHLNLSNWDLSNCESVGLGSFPFMSNADITSIDVSNWTLRTAGVALSSFIINCDLLTTVTGINTWVNTTGLTSFSNILNGNALVSSIDFSGMDLSNCATFQRMCYVNASLSIINVTGMTLKSFGTISMNSALYWNNSGNLMDIIGLDTWNIEYVNNFTGFMSSTQMTTVEYDKLLISWDSQDAVNNLAVNFGTSKYTLGSSAETARAGLIANDLWTITDGGGI